MLFSSADALRSFLKNISRQNMTVGFVPTMGALHAGHLSLVKASCEENQITVVSIFVNPTQFNNPEDLKKYPRDVDKDIQLLTQEIIPDQKIDETKDLIVFLPSVDDVYGDKVASGRYNFGSLSEVMEGRHRPGHFDGVATIVEYFLRLIQPTRAYFGEKDFQQLQIIRKLTRDKGLPVEIRPMPIEREQNGLAMSSRNGRLTPEGFQNAAFIYKTLKEVQDTYGMKPLHQIHEDVESAFAKNKQLDLEYFQIAEEENLLPITARENARAPRAFIVAHIEDVRLIDNVPLKS